MSDHELREAEIHAERIRAGRCPKCGGPVGISFGVVSCKGPRCVFAVPLSGWHPESGYAVIPRKEAEHGG